MLSGWLKVSQPVSDGARVRTGVSDFKAQIPFLLPRECLAPCFTFCYIPARAL